MSVLLIAVFAQCATICQVAQCEAPQKASGCHHQEEPKPEKVCKDLAAILANLQLDIALPETPPMQVFVATYVSDETLADRLVTSASVPSSVLRI